MAPAALAPCVTKSSEVMILIVHNKQIFVFKKWYYLN